jgi:hypothetical protein
LSEDVVSSDQPTVAVADSPQHHRYEVTVDGVLVGSLAYHRLDDRTVFTHAEVDPKWQGRGIASQLTTAALDDTIAMGQQITPLCPFVVDFVRDRPEYAGHVDPAHR